MAICRTPFVTLSGDLAPCGRCPECLVNRKQLWTHRNILESYDHEQKCFLTLTYSDEHLPHNEEDTPTLHKEDVQRFIKKLRQAYPHKIRYYLVGEYGTAGERGINPHYHLLLYGIGHEHSELIQDKWRSAAGKGKKGDILGFAYVEDVTHQSIAYVVGYVEKKTEYNKQMYEEFNIVPEYSSMSLKPSIGFNSVPKIAALLKAKPEYLTEHGDVPYSIMHGPRSLPLGSYLREKIREELDLPHDIETYMNEDTGELIDKKIWHGKEEAKAQKRAEMQILQENTLIHDPKLPKDAQISKKIMHDYLYEQSHKNFDARKKLQYNSHTL
jgi:hypothetical protein